MATEMKLNPMTGEWDMSFEYTRNSGKIFVKLGEEQKSYIVRFMLKVRTYYPKDMERLRKIIKEEKYTISDRSWMNDYFRSGVNKIVSFDEALSKDINLMSSTSEYMVKKIQHSLGIPKSKLGT